MFFRCCEGVLGSHPRGRDVHINQFSVTFYGQEILVDTDFEMNCGRRYGLVGLNGSGKSTILACIGNREVGVYLHTHIGKKPSYIRFESLGTNSGTY